jgi:hypothetical protein
VKLLPTEVYSHSLSACAQLCTVRVWHKLVLIESGLQFEKASGLSVDSDCSRVAQAGYGSDCGQTDVSNRSLSGLL